MRGVGCVGFVNGRVAVGWRGGVEDGGGSKAVSGGVEKNRKSENETLVRVLFCNAPPGRPTCSPGVPPS